MMDSLIPKDRTGESESKILISSIPRNLTWYNVIQLFNLHRRRRRC